MRLAGGGDVYRGAAPNSRGSRDGRKRLGDFDASDTYNLPSTQEQILQEMIQSPKFAEKWADIANNVLPKTYYNANGWDSYNESYTDFTATDYANVKYTSKGLREAVSNSIDQSAVISGSGILNNLPEEETPVYYVATKAVKTVIPLTLMKAMVTVTIFSFSMTSKFRALRTGLRRPPSRRTIQRRRSSRRATSLIWAAARTATR